jgi:hypothetical protein
MIWLYHRHGEYLACEVRTCLQNAGFELLMTGSSRHLVEWYPDAAQIERRWDEVKDLLEGDGWGDVYERPGQPGGRRSFTLHVMPAVAPRRSTVRD